MPAAKTSPKSFYVRRSIGARIGFTGSIRSEAQAHREAQAWRDCGWTAEVVPNTAELRAEVRAWERASRAR
jgi:hypothetical protein